jgi:potassium voltage-gated channel Eag-related subfamily H member 2
MQTIVDISFLVDIILNFRTGYITVDGEIEYDSLLVARNYIKGWFCVDLLSGFPYSIVLLTNQSSGSGEW